MELEDLKRLRCHVNIAIDIVERGGMVDTRPMTDEEKARFKRQYGNYGVGAYDMITGDFAIKMLNSQQNMKAQWQEQLVFTNDFKIRFCNGFSALQRHAETCTQCAEYLRDGEGDLCKPGKKAIAVAMVLQEEQQ